MPTLDSLTFALGVPGASYTATGPDGFSDAGVTDATGVAETGRSYPPGSYSITWSYQGTTRTDSLDVTALSSPVQNFTPLNVTDPEAGSAAPLPPAPAPVPAADDAPDYPFAWSAYQTGKYFTPTQAFLYIGDLYIDELSGFQYTLQANRIPVFGYSSSLMDAVGRGKSLIQGQFSLNFVSEGYLFTVLDQYARRAAQPRPADEQAAINIARQLAVLQSDPNPQAEALLKQELRKLVGANPSLTGVVAGAQKDKGQSYNAVYSNIPFDIVMVFEGGGRTITKRINQCVLTSNEMLMGSNDDVILDAYGFLARSTQ